MPRLAMSTVAPVSCDEAVSPSTGAAFLLCLRSRRWVSASRTAESMTSGLPNRRRYASERRRRNATVCGRAYRRFAGSPRAITIAPLLGRAIRVPDSTASCTSISFWNLRSPIWSTHRFCRKRDAREGDRGPGLLLFKPAAEFKPSNKTSNVFLSIVFSIHRGLHPGLRCIRTTPGCSTSMVSPYCSSFTSLCTPSWQLLHSVIRLLVSSVPCCERKMMWCTCRLLREPQERHLQPSLPSTCLTSRRYSSSDRRRLIGDIPFLSGCIVTPQLAILILVQWVLFLVSLVDLARVVGPRRVLGVPCALCLGF